MLLQTHTSATLLHVRYLLRRCQTLKNYLSIVHLYITVPFCLVFKIYEYLNFETILSAVPPTPEQHNYEDKLLCESEVTDADTDDCQKNKAELMVIFLKTLV